MKLLTTLCLSVFCCAALRADSPADAILKQADAAYALRTDVSQAREALDLYQKASAAEPNRADAYWKAARAAYWVGDHAENRTERVALFKKGIALAQEALKHNPDSVESHFWLGVNYGSFGETKGVMKSLALIKPIRREMAEVNRLNDRYDGGGGYRVLGVMDYKVPGIAGGSKKRAIEQLNKSLAIDADNPFTHFYLAEYYQMINDPAKMKSEWETLKGLKVAPDLEPEHAMLLRKGEKAFEK